MKQYGRAVAFMPSWWTAEAPDWTGDGWRQTVCNAKPCSDPVADVFPWNNSPPPQWFFGEKYQPICYYPCSLSMTDFFSFCCADTSNNGFAPGFMELQLLKKKCKLTLQGMWLGWLRGEGLNLLGFFSSFPSPLAAKHPYFKVVNS